MAVYGNLSQWTGYENYYSVGIIRGLAGVTLGAECYVLFSEWIKKWRNITKLVLVMFAVLAIGALVFARNYISFSDEVIYPYVFAMLLVIVYEREKKNKYLEKIFCYLGKISYGIFLVHYGVCKLLTYYWPGYGYIEMMLICVCISVLLGTLLTNVSQLIMKKI